MLVFLHFKVDSRCLMVKKMKQVTYELRTNAEVATNLIYGEVLEAPPHDWFPATLSGSPTHQKRTTVVQSSDGVAYVGFLERIADEGKTIYGSGESSFDIPNTLRLSFVLGYNQSTEPLDEKLAGVGFTKSE